MKRKLKLIIVFIFIFLLIMYFGIEGKGFENIDNDSLKFLSTSLDSFQKYLFTITIFVGLVIILVQVPFFNPEIKSRIKNNVFQYVWGKYLLIIIILCSYLLLSFFVVSFVFGYNNIFSILSLPIFFRLFTFVLACFVFYTFIYFISSNQFLAISTVIASNFLLLIIINAINFYLMNNTIDDNTTIFILSLYSGVINVFGLTYLYFYMDKKECLK